MYDWMNVFLMGKNYSQTFSEKVAKGLVKERKIQRKKEGKIRKRKITNKNDITGLSNPVLADLINDF